MFELTQQQVKLSSVNPRAEIHGTEKKPACDLKFEYAADNAELVRFAPDLRDALYKRPDDQGDLIDPERLSVLRFPKMGAFKFELAGKGYKLVMDYGLGDKSNIELAADIDGFKLLPQNGGTVIIMFRAVVHPDEVAFGKLCSFVQRDVEITLTPPAPNTIGELFGESPEPQQEPETADEE
ncbi:hypothetical protein [Cupriavidus oxalaticus]|uniref:hypothetical protein n=1 Tax=Cupriavidus oxalaticus TaxID=96344 RepID=UPI00316E802B